MRGYRSIAIKEVLVPSHSVYRNYFEMQETRLWAEPLRSAPSVSTQGLVRLQNRSFCIMYAPLNYPNAFLYFSTVGVRARFQVRILFLCCMLSKQDAPLLFMWRTYWRTRSASTCMAYRLARTLQILIYDI
jgi:hypothetical protein